VVTTLLSSCNITLFISNIDRKGLRKFSNFEKLIEQDRTGMIMQYVYVGDTGELDQEAGETMLREYPEVVKAVFLHVVSDRPYPRIPPPKLINGRPVIFFRTVRIVFLSWWDVLSCVFGLYPLFSSCAVSFVFYSTCFASVSVSVRRLVRWSGCQGLPVGTYR